MNALAHDTDFAIVSAPVTEWLALSCKPARTLALAAARVGATSVILPSGHKVIIANNCVITVKPVSCHKRNKGRKA